MKDNKDKTTDGFFSRGCCQSPNIYHPNKSVFNNKCAKLTSYDWLDDIPLPDSHEKFDIAEVRFKNSHKEFMKHHKDLEFTIGDIVAVEAVSGHDIGIISLTGEAVKIQLARKKALNKTDGFRKIYRRARLVDIEKWIESVDKEHVSMIKARRIADELKLKMKISDVEYQGDDSKAIFYYTADERVDFRELIKLFADEFKVRIEMRQIGARQESARVGGIGSCGRELCCSTWLCNFKSVNTHAARVQQMALNPQKLAGQCAKLKCCINYETEVYAEAIEEFPPMETVLKTQKGNASTQKIDVFKRIMWFSYFDDPLNLMAIPIEKVKLIMAENKKGSKPEKLEDFAMVKEKKADYNPADEENNRNYEDFSYYS